MKRRSELGLRDLAVPRPLARALASAVAVGRTRRGGESSDDEVEGLSPEDSVSEDREESESAAAGLGEDEWMASPREERRRRAIHVGAVVWERGRTPTPVCCYQCQCSALVLCP